VNKSDVSHGGKISRQDRPFGTCNALHTETSPVAARASQPFLEASHADTLLSASILSQPRTAEDPLPQNSVVQLVQAEEPVAPSSSTLETRPAPDFGAVPRSDFLRAFWRSRVRLARVPNMFGDALLPRGYLQAAPPLTFLLIAHSLEERAARRNPKTIKRCLMTVCNCSITIPTMWSMRIRIPSLWTDWLDRSPSSGLRLDSRGHLVAVIGLSSSACLLPMKSISWKTALTAVIFSILTAVLHVGMEFVHNAENRKRISVAGQTGSKF